MNNITMHLDLSINHVYIMFYNFVGSGWYTWKLWCFITFHKWSVYVRVVHRILWLITKYYSSCFITFHKWSVYVRVVHRILWLITKYYSSCFITFHKWSVYVRVVHRILWLITKYYSSCFITFHKWSVYVRVVIVFYDLLQNITHCVL